jgi:hypothetical protein
MSKTSRSSPRARRAVGNGRRTHRRGIDFPTSLSRPTSSSGPCAAWDVPRWGLRRAGSSPFGLTLPCSSPCSGKPGGGGWAINR